MAPPIFSPTRSRWLSSGARPISREEAPRLYAVMERLAAKANLPMPKLYFIPQAAPNAFATGRNPRHASVAVTQGLLQLMNDEELEGVIAHELSHVRNYDILTSSIAATIAGAITWIAAMGNGTLVSAAEAAIATRKAVSTGLLMLIRRAACRAAAAAGHFAPARISGGRFRRQNGRPSLWLDSARSKNSAPTTNASRWTFRRSTSALCIVAPLTPGKSMAGLFATHPPLADRIARLRTMTVTR